MKRLVVGCAVAVCLTVLIASLVVRNISLEWLRPIVEKELSETLGLKVHLANSPRVQLTPELEISVEGVRIENLHGRPSPYLLEVEQLSLEPRLWHLLRGVLVIESLELSGASLRIEPDAEGSWPLRPNLDEIDEPESVEKSGPLRLSIREITVDGFEIFFDRFGESDVTTVHLDRFRAHTGGRNLPVEFEAEGRVEGNQFGFTLVTGSVAQFLEPTEPFPVDLTARLREGRLQAAGTLMRPRTLEGAAIRLDVEIADLANGARLFGLALPSLGGVHVRGSLVERDGLLGVEDLNLKSDQQAALDLQFEGKVRDLLRFEGVDVQMKVGVKDIDLFRQWTKLSLPGTPLEADLALEDADGSLGVAGEVEASRPGSFELDLQGGFGDLRRLKELDVRIGFETKTLDSILNAFAERLPFRLPDLGPIEATSRLVLENGRLGLKEIKATLGDPDVMSVHVEGSVADVFAARGVVLDARVAAKSASRVAALFDRSIPEIGPLDLTLSGRDADGSLGIESVTLRVGAGEDFNLRLSGAFDDLAALAEAHFNASFSASDLGLVGELFDLDLPAVGPISFSGEIRGSRTDFSSSGRVKLKNTEIHGEIETHTKQGERPNSVIRVQSELVHLSDLFAKNRLQPLPLRKRVRSRFDFSRWWSGEEPLPLDLLHSFDARIDVTADRVTGYELVELRDFRVIARVKDGKLTLEDLGADYEGGKVSGQLAVDAKPVVPELSMEVEAFNVDLTKLMSQFQEGTEYAGFLDLSVRLGTTGSRAPEMRAGLEGVFGAMLREGSIVNDYAKALSFDILRVSIPSFGGTSEGEKPVHCLLALLPIKDGIAEIETLYLEGKKVTIVGHGEIDLVKDELAVRLTPKLHEPGLVSIAATVDVEGPIESPKIEPIRGSMVTSALGALYRNALRPVSAMGKLAFGNKANPEKVPDACGLIARQRVSQMLTHAIEPIDLDAAVKEAGRD